MECFLGLLGPFKDRLDRKGSQNPMIRLKAPHFLQRMLSISRCRIFQSWILPLLIFQTAGIIDEILLSRNQWRSTMAS